MKNPKYSSSLMIELKKTGIKIAIDDFGTGYSSLGLLKQFRIDTLKIDRSFIRDICHNKGDQAVVNAIISMAHDLGMKTIAEGVETKEQDRKSTRLNSSHVAISYAVFCLKQK